MDAIIIRFHKELFSKLPTSTYGMLSTSARQMSGLGDACRRAPLLNLLFFVLKFRFCLTNMSNIKS